MIDRWLSKLELFLLRRAPSYSVSIRSRRYHTIQKDVPFLELFDRMQKQGVIIQSVNEAYNLWQLCPQTARVEGDVAEVGVYLGGTARLLSQVKGNRRLFLFDTFGGMPQVKEGVDKVHAGTFAETRLGDVQRLMEDQTGVHFCPGFFPETTKLLPSDAQRFSFVHLDVDISRHWTA